MASIPFERIVNTGVTRSTKLVYGIMGSLRYTGKARRIPVLRYIPVYST